MANPSVDEGPLENFLTLAMDQDTDANKLYDFALEENTNFILLALSKYLGKHDISRESEMNTFLKIMVVLDKFIKVLKSWNNEDHIKIIRFLAGVLSNLSNRRKAKQRKKGEEGSDQMEELPLNKDIYKAVCTRVADCLKSSTRIPGAPILLNFTEYLWPKIQLMNIKGSREERTIFLRICSDVVELCGEDLLREYGDRLVQRLGEWDVNDPSNWQIVAVGISMFAEFGGSKFRRHLGDTIPKLEGILTSPAQLDSNKVEHEIALISLGKIYRFQCCGNNKYQHVDLWLKALPIKYNLAEAKIVHADLVTLLEMSERKVLGGHPKLAEFSEIIRIFTEVMWAGKQLATADTLSRMKKLLKMYRGRVMPRDFKTICSTIPPWRREMLESALDDAPHGIGLYSNILM